MALSYITATATQASADAFVQTEMQTALAGINNVAYRVREVLFEITSAIASVNDSEIGAVIARRSKAARPSVADRDVLVGFNRYAKLVTSGAYVLDRIIRMQFSEDDELLVVEDPLYLVVDSTLTAVANVIVCRIGYERVSINALDRLTLLTASLD